MTFANIEYFFLLLLLIPYILWYVLKNKKKEPTLLVSDTTAYRYAPKSYKNHLIHAPFILRLFTFVMVIIILAIHCLLPITFTVTVWKQPNRWLPNL